MSRKMDCEKNNRSTVRQDNNGSNNNGEDLLLHKQSLDLRFQLESLLEYNNTNTSNIHRYLQNGEVPATASVLEEKYVLLISSYPPQCLHRAVLMTVAADNNNYNEVVCLMEGTATSSSLRLPIHLACDKNAPLSIIRSLLEADQTNQSILQADKWGDLPIHIACSRAAKAATAVPSNNAVYRRNNGNGAIDRHVETAAAAAAKIVTDRTITNETVEIIRLLLQADQQKQTLYVKDVFESLPIHTSARYNAPPEVIELLLDNDIVNRRMKKRDGNNHNHNTNNTNSTAAVSTLYTEGLHGQYPLMVACRNGNPSPQVLKTLLKYDYSNDHTNNTIFHKDDTGRLPIHVYMLRNKCTECLYVLLEAMLMDRIINVGLLIWKYQVQYKMITAMDNLYERNFTTRDKLDIICIQFQCLYEKCVLLELIVWKMSCLIGVKEMMNKETTVTTTTTTRNNSVVSSSSSSLSSSSLFSSSSEHPSQLPLNDIIRSTFRKMNTVIVSSPPPSPPPPLQKKNNRDTMSTTNTTTESTTMNMNTNTTMTTSVEMYDETEVVVSTTCSTTTFKINRRIVSNSETIVPHILSFIEDEPITSIMESFKSFGYTSSTKEYPTVT